MPRPHLQIEIEGETPIRIITSPEKESGFFNLLTPTTETRKDGEWDWNFVEEIVGLTEEEVLERLTTALRGLPSRQPDGRRKMVQG